MSKRILFYILCFLLIAPVEAKSAEPLGRGLYVSVVQDPQVLESREEMVKLIDFAKQIKVKILFVQIYRSNQAWFPSKIADGAPYERCRNKLSEDPLAFLIKKAHEQGIEVHAWLNLMSLGANKDAPFIKKYGMDILTQNLQEKKSLEDYKIDNQYFLEPGDPRVHKDLAGIVGEILRAYPDLDGIQYDYIRYPDVKPHYGFTKANTERFKKKTGLKTIDENDPRWGDWKRAQVTELLTELVKKARAMRPHIRVSSTGCMPYARAYYEAFQDWPLWADSHVVDFVTLMNYADDPVAFDRAIATAKSKIKDFAKVKIAVGTYKFTHAPEKFAQELASCEANTDACVIFNYGSLRGMSDLKDILTGLPK